uniref:Uncharacterized protein n=1 Tax=Musca domestica TaxID=7370 RepID=A0A1I8MFU3_MUSDO
MANSAVFPGGVFEPSDETPLWRKHFEKMGATKQLLAFSEGPKVKKSVLFENDNPEAIDREISLRIAAIREAFEELGVIFCRDRKSLALGGGEGYGNFREDFDRNHWQKLVHNDSTNFLELCEALEIVPDLWSLHQWSNWFTPTTYKKRYNTAFFLIALREIPDVTKENNEVTDFAWRTPGECLRQHFNGEIWLPPPQIYELSRLLNFAQLEDVKNFALQRRHIGLDVTLLIEYDCQDARVYLMPADDLYSVKNCQTQVLVVDKTAQQFREGVKNIHRIEVYGPNDAVVRLNFKLPHGHVGPINANPKKRD